MWTLFASALLFVAPAHAAPTPVLVSSWQARNADAVGLAGLIEDYLARELARSTDLAVVRIEDTPRFPDYDARAYMDGCPPGDVVGCTQVIAERANAVFAVTGTVQSLAEGSRVEVEILDVAGSRIAVNFTSELGDGEDQTFAAGVARVLVAAIRGEVGREIDIRDGEAEAAPIDKDAVAAQLTELSQQLHEATVQVGEPNQKIERSTYTLGDLAKRAETEGATPWDRLHMSPSAYLHYKNSGLDLMEWRRRAVGRQGQLLLRVGGAYWNGPVAGVYYARYAVGDALEVVDSYSAQGTGGGPAAGPALAVTYGVLPALEVGVAGLYTGGNFLIDVNQEQVGAPDQVSDTITFPSSTFAVGPRAQVTFFPVKSVRPLVGAGLDFVSAHSVDDYLIMPDAVQTFPARAMTYGWLTVGGEAKLGKHLDFFLHVPIGLLVAGGQGDSVRTGSLEEVEAQAPATAPGACFSVQAGLQIRLFGKDTSKDVYYDDPDEG